MENNRKLFINYFFREITNLRYAYLKFAYKTVDEIPETSDIDLLIDKHELNGFLDIIRKGNEIEMIDLHRKTFVTFVNVYFNDGSYLELDLINRFERKGIIYLDSETVLNHAVKEGILKLAAENHNFEYIMLFNIINNSNIPKRYRDFYTSFNCTERSKIFSYLCNKYDLSINLLDELYDKKTYETRNKLQQYGTEKGRNKYHQNIWIRGLDIQIETFSRRCSECLIIICDVRFKNEYDYIIEKGGKVFRIESKERTMKRYLNESGNDLEKLKIIQNHISETELDNQKFDYTINNDETFDLDEILKLL